VQSSSQIITTNKPISSFFTDWMAFLSPNQQCQSTEGKYHIPWTCLPQAHLGVFQLCLGPLIAPGYLGEGCHASHQSSDVSTPRILHRVCPHYCLQLSKILLTEKCMYELLNECTDLSCNEQRQIFLLPSTFTLGCCITG